MNQTTVVKFNRLPDISFTFERVNILLGANGTGKSKTLKELKESAGGFFPGRSVIYVEGGRTIKLVNTLELNRNNFQNYNTLERAKTTYTQKRKNTLSERVIDALMLLDREGQEIKSSHSDAVHQWDKDGRQGNVPGRQEPPLNKLFELFSEIFPTITLRLNSENKTLTCTKNNKDEYSPVDLSDGEKQVLSILADIASLAEKNSLILIDEPELNLNPSLASRLWDTIENELPECIFIYTTHDVGFSMRSNVNRVFVLSNTNESISEISNLGEIQPNDLRALLGSIPAILSTSSALITEGKSNSFDTIFYRWLTQKTDIEIVPMGGSEDVLAVASRSGVWKTIAPNVKLFGVTDRDFKSDETLSGLNSDSCLTLELHEAESYLCLPEIVKYVAEQMGLVKDIPTIESLEKIIISEFEELVLSIAAQRVFGRTTLRLEVSLQKSVLKATGSKEELEQKLIEESNKQKEYADQKLSEEEIKKLLQEELGECQKAIDENDIEKMLRLMPGKGLMAKMSQLVGARSPSDYARACAKHISPNKFSLLSNLSSSFPFDSK